MQFGTKRFEWFYDTPLLSGANVVVPLGKGGGLPFADGRSMLWLTWGIISELAWTFYVEGDMYPDFPGPVILASQGCLPATYYTPYQLALPMTGTHIVITRPFVRIRSTDGATADHAYTEIYVKGWWE
jgi:hypothetical protein